VEVGRAPGAPARREGGVVQAGERRSARIESLRALSALAVLSCHAWAFTNLATLGTFHSRVILGAGFLGVDVFFALTGFLIFLPFARRDYGHGPPVDLGGYALNRALRILPLYYVVLVIVAAIDGTALTTFLRFALFSQSFSQSLVAKVLDGPMWSLVVELHFYVLLPLLAWVLARLSRGSAGRAAALLVGLGAASTGVYEAGFHPFEVWTYSLPASFVYFVPGMLLAIASVRLQGRVPRWTHHPLARADLWLLAAVGVWLALFLDPTIEIRLLPLAIVGTALVVGSCTLPIQRRGLDRLLDVRPLAWVGVISYSLYLWHWPLLNWLPRPGMAGYGGWLVFMAYAIPVCLVAAWISYRLVEAPALRFRRRWFAGSTAPGPARPAGKAPVAVVAPAGPPGKR